MVTMQNVLSWHQATSRMQTNYYYYYLNRNMYFLKWIKKISGESEAPCSLYERSKNVKKVWCFHYFDLQCFETYHLKSQQLFLREQMVLVILKQVSIFQLILWFSKIQSTDFLDRLFFTPFNTISKLKLTVISTKSFLRKVKCAMQKKEEHEVETATF